MSLLWEQLSFLHGARTVQRHDKFRPVEHCMFEVLVERDGIVRTSIDTELAEHTRTQVIFILSQDIFFFLPSSVSTVSLVTLIVSFGQAIWHKPQATQRCSLFSLWGMFSVPRKRSKIFNVERFSGYCSVVFRRQYTVMVVFIPVSSVLMPCMSPPI